MGLAASLSPPSRVTRLPAGAWSRGLADPWHGRGPELIFTGDSGRGLPTPGMAARYGSSSRTTRAAAMRITGNGRGSGFVLLGDLDRGHSDTGHAARGRPRASGRARPHEVGPTAPRAAVVSSTRMTARSGTPPQAPRAAVVHRNRAWPRLGVTLTGAPGRGHVGYGAWPRHSGSPCHGSGSVSPAGSGTAAMSIQGMAAILDSRFTGEGERGHVSTTGMAADPGHPGGREHLRHGHRAAAMSIQGMAAVPGTSTGASSRGLAHSTHGGAVGVTPSGDPNARRVDTTHSRAGATPLAVTPAAAVQPVRRRPDTTKGSVGVTPTNDPNRTLVGREHDRRVRPSDPAARQAAGKRTGRGVARSRDVKREA